jgi:preprotein translocase subunit SecA
MAGDFAPRRDRKILLYHEKERQKMQRQMSQDPYLDTPG